MPVLTSIFRSTYIWQRLQWMPACKASKVHVAQNLTSLPVPDDASSLCVAIGEQGTAHTDIGAPSECSIDPFKKELMSFSQA